MQNETTSLIAYLTGTPLLLSETYLQSVVESGGMKFDLAARTPAKSEDIPGLPGVTIQGKTAIVPVHGPISSRGGFWASLFGLTSYEDVGDSLRALAAMSGVKNVILDVDSPGGTVFGVTEAESAVHSLRSSGKNVISYISGMGCSAAYWFPSAADMVIASPTALVGSVGVVAYAPTEKDKGYKAYTSAGAKNKNKEAHNLQENLNAIEAVFHKAVTTNRGITEAYLKANWGEGAVFSAEAAKANRMIDAIANLSELL